MTLYIGLMSGTSLDGVDGVLADLQDGPAGRPRVLAHRHLPLQTPVQQQLLLLNRRGDDELHRAALAGNELMQCYASVVAELLRTGEVEPAQVRAIGAHGQTVRHRPQEFDALGGYTLQLMNGALLAELCGIDVVCDFRSRDLAAGGQGAPLVPALHAALFASAADNVAVLNLGGIANLTLLPVGGEVLGFDCGPGNALLDGWCQQHLGTVFDDAGRWAAAGHVDEALLQQLLAEPYLARPPPKSTGRDLFHMPWLQAALQQAAPAAVTGGRPGHADGVQRARRDRRAATVRATHPPLAGVRRWCLQCAPDATPCHAPAAGLGAKHRRLGHAAAAGGGAGLCLAGPGLRLAPAGQPAQRDRRARPAPAGCLVPGTLKTPNEKRAASGQPFVVETGSQAEKLDPQPQVVVAFGFLMTNCAPCRSSL